MFREKFKAKQFPLILKAAIDELEKIKKVKCQRMEEIKQEVINHLKDKKTLVAQVCVERIIREDNLLVAVEIIQMLCEVLYKKVGLIESKEEIEESLCEAVSTLIWAAPHLAMEVPELQNVAHQLCLKYSKEFGLQCRSGKTGFVNKTVMQKLNADTPSESVREKRLCDIAQEAGIKYQPTVPLTDDTLGKPIGHGLGDAFGRPSNAASPPYPVQNSLFSGFPDAGNNIFDVGMKSPGNASNSSEANASDINSPTCGIGFRTDILNDSEDLRKVPDVPQRKTTDTDDENTYIEIEHQ